MNKDRTSAPFLLEEHRLRVYENRVTRRIFGPKRLVVKGEWRKVHNEELHNLYSPPDLIRMVRSRRGEKCVQNFCRKA
jgi:hypothetical protein